MTGLGVVRLIEAIRHTDPTIPLLPGLQQRDVRLDPTATERRHGVSSAQSLRSGEGLCVLGNRQLPQKGSTSMPATASCSTTRARGGARRLWRRKISSAIPRLITGELNKLTLGNLDARRDWGHARDYVRAMRMMLAHDEPLDLVIGTGTAYSVRDFLNAAFCRRESRLGRLRGGRSAFLSSCRGGLPPGGRLEDSCAHRLGAAGEFPRPCP